MRKNLIINLKSLAHDILNLEADQDLSVLRKKTEEIYDKLVILDYLTKNIDSLEEESVTGEFEESQVSNIETKLEEIVTEEITEDYLAELYEEKIPEEIEIEQEVSDKAVSATEIENSNLEDYLEENKDNLEDLFEPTFDSIKEDFSQKEEFKDTISLDETEKLFETKRTETKPVSLNDKLLGRKIQVGLNDRIAFVNSLFNFNQSDFNRILNELNSFETEIEAKNYIQNSIKKKYDWSGKEDVEERFILLVERKFL
jgi:ribosomal protein S3AE